MSGTFEQGAFVSFNLNFNPFTFVPFEQGLAAPFWISVFFPRASLPFEQGLALYLPLLLALVFIQDEAVDGICQVSVAKGCPCRLVPLVPHMLLMWCGDGVHPDAFYQGLLQNLCCVIYEDTDPLAQQVFYFAIVATPLVCPGHGLPAIPITQCLTVGFSPPVFTTVRHQVL